MKVRKWSLDWIAYGMDNGLDKLLSLEHVNQWCGNKYYMSTIGGIGTLKLCKFRESIQSDIQRDV